MAPQEQLGVLRKVRVSIHPKTPIVDISYSQPPSITEIRPVASTASSKSRFDSAHPAPRNKRPVMVHHHDEPFVDELVSTSVENDNRSK